MTRDFIEALLRTFMQMLGVFIMARFGISEEMWLGITGAVLSIAGLAWMMVARWNTEKVPVGASKEDDE